MDKHKLLGAIGLVALLPSISQFFSFIGFVFALIGVFQSAAATGNGIDPRLLAGETSSHIVHQLLGLIILIPGLVFVTISVRKGALKHIWFSRCLGIYSWLLIVSLPLLTLAGIYIQWLKRKTVA